MIGDCHAMAAAAEHGALTAPPLPGRGVLTAFNHINMFRKCRLPR